MQDIILRLENISKVFGNNKVLNNINLDIEKGKFITFLGPSGCGKTTLLRTIAGFYTPDQGQVIINGNRVDNLPPYKRNTPMVFQEYALFPHMNVFDNIAYGLKLQREDKDNVKNRAEKVINLMQLKGLENRYPHEMSGGQQQRVAIARALVMNPEILLLDEPLSNLDAKLRESVRVEIRLIQKKLGLTVIYVTHDQSEALSMSDKVVVFNKGCIDQYGTPREIYFKPNTRYVADFIGTTNLLQGIVVESHDNMIRVKYMDYDMNLISDKHAAGNEKITLSIRPESIYLTSKEENNELIKIKGIITHAMFLGEKVRYFVKDSNEKEWIIDSFDTGKDIIEGEVFINIAKDKPHVIIE